MLAARRFRRAAGEIGIAHELREQRFAHAAGSRHRAVRVIALFAVCDARNGRIDEHVARPGVERRHVGKSAPRREQRDVPDAADILERRVFGLAAIEQKLRIRHERRAEPARGHIAHAEIAHDRAAEALGKHRLLAELERACEGAREVFFFFRNVPERLAVAADEINVGELCAGLRAERLARLAEKLAEQEIHPAEVRCRGRTASGKTQDLRAHFVRKRHEAEAELLCARLRAKARDANECGVHAVRRCAGHEPDHEPRRLFPQRFQGMFHTGEASRFSYIL